MEREQFNLTRKLNSYFIENNNLIKKVNIERLELFLKFLLKMVSLEIRLSPRTAIKIKMKTTFVNQAKVFNTRYISVL